MHGLLGVCGRNLALVRDLTRGVLNPAKIRGEVLGRGDIDFQNYRLGLLNGEGPSGVSTRIGSDQGDETSGAGAGNRSATLEPRNGDEALIRKGRREDGKCGNQYSGAKPGEPSLRCELLV